ncbi:hypothetical protein BJ508DRAFT_216628 [Ascobolus immersus RN42]|uniref:Rhodopsin domain-containing protein n=1 Tax=Ascobolus immersus RN42 TaxID=1160509 RepID=A0A3N4HT58_ASCIM|nr:hypothetical protein BJ508DRAFT_216628 [Ascobolus immersus RN42]
MASTRLNSDPFTSLKPNYVNPQERGSQLRTLGTGLCTLTLLVVAMRLAARIWIIRRVQLDDWLCLAGLTLTISMAACIIRATYYGVGYHYYDIPDHWWLPQQRLLFMAFVLYNPAVALVKASIIIFFSKLGSHINFFRWACRCLLTLITVSALATTLVAIFACNPIDFVWHPDRYGKTNPTQSRTPDEVKCFDQTTLLVVFGSINAITDVMTLVLPFPLAYRMRLPKRQKIAIYLIFSLGAVVCVTTILRLSFIERIRRRNNIDYTFDLFPIGIIAEPTAGIICGSLPVIGPAFALYFPRVFSASPAELRSTSPDDHKAGLPNFRNSTQKPIAGGDLRKYGVSDEMLVETQIDVERDIQDGNSSIRSGVEVDHSWQMDELTGEGHLKPRPVHLR